MTIHIDAELILAVLDDGRNWVKGKWGDASGAMCLHGAIRRCAPAPGDAELVQQVAQRQGWGTLWNDDAATSWPDIRARVNGGIDVTDDDLADTFGPSWRAVVWVVRTIASASPDQIKALAAARDAARGADWDAAWGATWDARDAAWDARDAAWDAARAAWDAARGAAWGAARGTAWDAGRDAAKDAAWGAAVLDLVGPHRLTQAHIDTLMGPFVSVFGPVEDGDVHRANRAVGEG